MVIRVDYAGPGGSCEGIRMAGYQPIGIEFDRHACATRTAAGHLTIRADLTTYRPHHKTETVEGYWASPPCQAFSVAGSGDGIAKMSDLVSAIDTETWADLDLLGDRARHVGDAARTAIELHPAWVCMEQVPTVQPAFEAIARRLVAHGYSTWVGVLNAADFGVPQVRRRVILMASRVRGVSPPPATHAAKPEPSLFGSLNKWVTMAEALGWTGTEPRASDWCFARPSTAVSTDPRISPPGYRGLATDYAPDGTYIGERSMDNAIKLTIEEAMLLQSFRPGYPVQGRRRQKFEQIGNAVPPLLAAHIVAAVTGTIYPPPDTGKTMTQTTELDLRLAVTEAVITCQRCPRHTTCDAPVSFAGPTPADIVVIGDNPALPDDQQGQPFKGPAGQLLRKHLETASIETDRVGFMNTISCYTPDTPTGDEVEACRVNATAQLDLFDPKWVLLLGKVALQAFRPDLEISHARGTPFTHTDWPGVVFFPMYHPAYAMRQNMAEKAFAADLRVFAQMVEQGDPMPFIADRCGRCGIEAFYWEGTMVGWGNCGKDYCGIPKQVQKRLSDLFVQTDELPCRASGCSQPAVRHPRSFPTGTAPEQMTWDSLAADDQKLMHMVFTGGDRGVTVEALVNHVGSGSTVSVVGNLDRLEALGWVLRPSEGREDRWVMSPRAKRLMVNL